MEERTGFLGISGTAWGVIGILTVAALMAISFWLDVGNHVA